MPEPGTLVAIVFGIFGIAFAYAIYRIVRESAAGARERAAAREKQEALFQATFPDLQPHFHPEKVLQYVTARSWRGKEHASFNWASPPGFAPRASRAEIEPDPKGERVRLLDAGGAPLRDFIYQDVPEGGVLRIGPGKMTVNLKDSAVRYWHPQREFKWSKLKGWRVISSLSDRPLEFTDRGTSYSSDSSYSSSDMARAAAAGAVVGAGGTFDGGGASAAWDGGSGAGGDGSASRTSY